MSAQYLYVYGFAHDLELAGDRALHHVVREECLAAAGGKAFDRRDGLQDVRETVFRVYDGPERFTDYEIRHNDLSVTIEADELAAFYKVGERDILDHDPRVLGLRKIEG